MVYGNSSCSIFSAMLLVKELAYSLLTWVKQALCASRIDMIILLSPQLKFVGIRFFSIPMNL